jgi:hypothetical protein
VIFKNPRETHAFPLLSTTTHKSEGTYRSTARNSRSDVNIKAAWRRQKQQDSGMKAMRKHHAGIAARTRHEKLHENNKANENSESNLKQTRQSSEAQARSGKPKWSTLKATRKQNGTSHHHSRASIILIMPSPH